MIDTKIDLRPSIAVLICVYNPSIYLIKQVHSICEQKDVELKDITLIFSNDSCEVNSFLEKSIELAKKKLGQVYLINGPRTGHPKDNFLNGILSLKDYDWIFLSDQDDIWAKNKVSKYLEVVLAGDINRACIIFSDASLIDSNDKTLTKSFVEYQGLNVKAIESHDILYTNCVQGATLCLNNKMVELLNESTKIRGTDNILMHDWWLAILAAHYAIVYYLPEQYLMYRQHTSNVIGAKKKSSIVEILFGSKLYMAKLKSVYSQRKRWEKEDKVLALSYEKNVLLKRLTIINKIKKLIIMFTFPLNN